MARTPKPAQPARRPGATRGPASPAPDLTERFQVRCSPDDLERWGQAARDLGLTIGQWLRMLAHKELRAK